MDVPHTFSFTLILFSPALLHLITHFSSLVCSCLDPRSFPHLKLALSSITPSTVCRGRRPLLLFKDALSHVCCDPSKHYPSSFALCIYILIYKNKCCYTCKQSKWLCIRLYGVHKNKYIGLVPGSFKHQNVLKLDTKTRHCFAFIISGLNDKCKPVPDCPACSSLLLSWTATWNIYAMDEKDNNAGAFCHWFATLCFGIQHLSSSFE